MFESLTQKLAFDFDTQPERLAKLLAWLGKWTDEQRRDIQVGLVKLRAAALRSWCGFEPQRWAWFFCGSFKRLAQNLEIDLDLAMPIMGVEWGWSPEQLEHVLAIVHGARLRFLRQRSVVR